MYFYHSIYVIPTQKHFNFFQLLNKLFQSSQRSVPLSTLNIVYSEQPKCEHHTISNVCNLHGLLDTRTIDSMLNLLYFI